MTRKRQAQAAARSTPCGTWAGRKFGGAGGHDDRRLDLGAALGADRGPLLGDPVGEPLVVGGDPRDQPAEAAALLGGGRRRGASAPSPERSSSVLTADRLPTAAPGSASVRASR